MFFAPVLGTLGAMGAGAGLGAGAASVLGGLLGNTKIGYSNPRKGISVGFGGYDPFMANTLRQALRPMTNDRPSTQTASGLKSTMNSLPTMGGLPNLLSLPGFGGGVY